MPLDTLVFEDSVVSLLWSTAPPSVMRTSTVEQLDEH